MSNPLPYTKQPASPPDYGLLGDVEMEDQQNNAAATDAVDATTAKFYVENAIKEEGPTYWRRSHR